MKKIKIIPDKDVCQNFNVKHKKYEVLDIRAYKTKVHLEFKIINDIGKPVWVKDLDCMEVA